MDNLNTEQEAVLEIHMNLILYAATELTTGLTWESLFAAFSFLVSIWILQSSSGKLSSC